MEIIKDEEEIDDLLSSTLTSQSNNNGCSILVNNEILSTKRPPVSSTIGKKFVRSNSEKRVEFSVGPAKHLNLIGKTRPKSALKRFNIDTHRQVDIIFDFN
jgi:hypothetical protein